jgi:hypothetical protein
MYLLMGTFFVLSPFAVSVAHASTTITTCTQLQNIGSTTGPLSGSYVLGGNIDCSATATWNPNGGGGYYGFSPIGDFTGTFNGAGYTISNLYISTTTSNVGLFSILDATSTVQNLTLSGGSVSGGADTGALAGQMIATSTVQNVTSSVPVTSSQSSLGGLVGLGASASTTIANSSSSGAIMSSQNSVGLIGGLVGHMFGTISNSFSSASVTVTGSSDEFIGGLAGLTNNPVSNSYATGTVIASGAGDEYVGGLIGESGGAITNTYETGPVTANGSGAEYVAGLIGENASGAVASSSATGVVTATGASGYYLGGLIGYSEGAISNSYSTGNVVGTTTSESIGGFIGYIYSGSVTQSYETGNVYGGQYEVGGFTSGNYAPITQSFSTGNVYALSGQTELEYAGGFAGYTESPTTNDYETGSILIDPSIPSVDVEYVGGFTGYTGGTVTNSYATGSITEAGTSGYDMGGFVGLNYDPIVNSFSTGGGTAFASTTGRASGYFIGENENTSLTNVAEFVHGTPAIGDDHNFGSVADALLATHGYGTDESTLSNFYSLNEPVYAQATSTPWNFSSIWETHPNALPTFIWYSGVQPTYTITANAGTGGIINNAGALTVQSGATQAYNIIPNSGYTIANVLVDGSSVGAVSTYTFTNVTASHTISVTFTAPVVSSSSTGGTLSGGSVQNRVANLIQDNNTPAAIAVENQYPNLFPSVSSGTSGSSTISATTFARSLTLGSIGADVKALQEYLNTHSFIIAATGAGSLGKETTYFGKATRAALAKFQKAKGISPSAGYFGSVTRAYIVAH